MIDDAEKGEEEEKEKAFGSMEPLRERKGQKKCHLQVRRKKPESKKMPFPLLVKQEKKEEKQRMNLKRLEKRSPSNSSTVGRCQRSTCG